MGATVTTGVLITVVCFASVEGVTVAVVCRTADGVMMEVLPLTGERGSEFFLIVDHFIGVVHSIQ